MLRAQKSRAMALTHFFSNPYIPDMIRNTCIKGTPLVLWVCTVALRSVSAHNM